jgi:FHS family L-fucose permease-like MFS transporter
MLQYILISLCFPMWGAAAALNDILITQFKEVFTLSNLASAFVQSAFYGGYFLIAIPASRVIRKTTYKLAVMIGLTFYIIGCALFFPASHLATYSVFLAAIFSMAVGLSFLETSCNTYSSMLGPKRYSTLRLNISQTFYPLGSIFGILLGKYLVFGQGSLRDHLASAQSPAERLVLAKQQLQQTLTPYKYIVVVLIIMLVLVAITRFPRCKPAEPAGAAPVKTGVIETLRHLAGNRDFRKGIGAQFAYVGMQTAVWSFTIRLALQLDHTITERSASTFMVYSYAAFFLGKVIANVLMSRLSSARVVAAYSVLGALCLVYVATVPNMSAVWAAIVASGLFGPCWATIYANTLQTIREPRFRETGGAIIVMSIIGGAVVPVIQGFVADVTGSMQLSFLVSAACFVVVLLYFAGEIRTARTVAVPPVEQPQLTTEEAGR